MGIRLRRLWMGLATVLGLARLGYFMPSRYAAQTPGAGRRPSYEGIEKILRSRGEDFLDVVSAIVGYAVELEKIGSDAAAINAAGRPQPTPAGEPRWDQDWFPRLDAAAAYALVRRLRPVRIVEVGSGHSTRFFARAARDGGFGAGITAIDPAPRADIAGLGIEVIAATVPAVGPGPFSRLGPGDVLSVDSSHLLMPGSDVDFLINDVLAGLPEGAIVHFHDIFLPDDYPPEWGWRAYNEQTAIAALVHSGGYEVLWSSRYVTTRMAGALAGTVIERLALVEGAWESSLWLRKGRGDGEMKGEGK